MASKVLYGVTFFDGIQLVTRCVVAVPGTTRYLVYDRYMDGKQYLISTRTREGRQYNYQLEEAVQLLEEVAQ